MPWWKKLFGRRDQHPASIGLRGAIHADDSVLGDLYVATASESAGRSETALPGTASVPRLLTLVPPPIDEELCRSAEDDTSRDYGPDPIAEYALSIPARAVFSVPQLSSAITPELMRYFALLTLYVRTSAGLVTYMVSSEAPKQAMEVIAGWNLGKEDKDLVQNIALGAQGLARWLAARQDGFAVVEPDPAEIAGQHQAARRIIEIEPNDVAIVALPKQPGHRFDGQKVWRLLHGLGLRWGDLDQFQWRDPTDQTDYLFWAEVDDGQLGYALPEEIAAGRQHFNSVQFVFNIARTPHPAHVLQEMARAAEVFAKQLDCQLNFLIDRTPAQGLQALEATVRQVSNKLQACGVKPGSSPVCRLR
jgi:hypothetical protein